MPKLSILSGRAFDTGLAGLAAVSAGFVAFAMPDALFTGLVETSRLPDLTALAQPPLGQTARLAAAGGACLATFASVWGLMAALGRAPARARPRAQPEAEAEAEAPRLRRADAHPDAPARRPLLARDLGEPLDLEPFAEAPAEEAPLAEADDRPLPGFLIPQAPEAEPIAEAEPVPEAELNSQGEPAWNKSRPAWTDFDAEPDPDPETQPEALPISELAARLPQAEEPSGEPLAQLVNRIEFGLSRKRQALEPGSELPPAEDEPAEQERVGHRLRSSITDLQKIASSGA